MIRKNGYLNLDNEEVLCKVPRNKGDDAVVFRIDGQEFYFKECDEIHSLLEIFCGHVAKIIEIPSVFYDLATYQNRKGVLSRTYNPFHFKEVRFYDILVHYYMFYMVENDTLCEDLRYFDSLFNLEDIWDALNFYYQEYPNSFSVINSLMEEVINAFFLQIFLGNKDVHFTQLTVLEDNFPHLSLNHDYSESCLIQMKNNFYGYALQCKRHDTLDKVPPKDTIYEFFNSFDESFQKNFEEKLLKLPSKEMVLDLMKEQLGIEGFEKKMLFFLKNYESYKMELMNILDCVRKNSR